MLSNGTFIPFKHNMLESFPNFLVFLNHPWEASKCLQITKNLSLSISTLKNHQRLQNSENLPLLTIKVPVTKVRPHLS